MSDLEIHQYTAVKCYIYANEGVTLFDIGSYIENNWHAARKIVDRLLSSGMIHVKRSLNEHKSNRYVRTYTSDINNHWTREKFERAPKHQCALNAIHFDISTDGIDELKQMYAKPREEKHNIDRWLKTFRASKPPFVNTYSEIGLPEIDVEKLFKEKIVHLDL